MVSPLYVLSLTVHRPSKRPSGYGQGIQDRAKAHSVSSGHLESLLMNRTGMYTV